MIVQRDAPEDGGALRCFSNIRSMPQGSDHVGLVPQRARPRQALLLASGFTVVDVGEGRT